ncbi:MAG: Ig-like domain-containing protein [Candidatus Falkowbacteria bacterium]|nr:Ig-like domain-containing protein [Candidatus Falkowbacteria bacterium]
MKQRYLRILVFSVALVAAGLFFLHSVNAANLNTGLDFAAQTGLSGQDIRITIAKIIRIILGFLGILAIGLTMYAGFLWMTSAGNEEKIAQAKLVLRNGVIGLIIILASFGIVSFILSRLMGATGSGGGNGNGNGNENGGGIGSLGNGIVKSVYPEPFQKDVPRNTSIVVSFREPILASSICDLVTNESPAKCSPGAKIKPLSIKIFKTTVGDNATTNLNNVTVTSVDNKVFIFKPAAPNYLGSPTEATNYTVKLTRDVKRADGSDAFKLGDFYWTFEVNNLLDLTSPKIKNLGDGGMFPVPDNEADVISGVQQAVAATGSITINGAPSAYRASGFDLQRLVPPLDPKKASVSGTNRCSDGSVTVSILTNGISARLGYSQPGLLPADVNIINNKIDITPCGISLSLEAGFKAGHSWRIDVVAEKSSDKLTVGSRVYSFVSSNPGAGQILVGANNDITAQNIADAIDLIHPEVEIDSVSGKLINIKAKVAGSSGNSIGLSTTNQVAIALGQMHGGRDLSNTYKVKDKQDQPKNTVIQINFNEAVNPLMVSGTSSEVKDNLRVVNIGTKEKPALAGGADCVGNDVCRSYKCTAGKCEGDQIAGSFTISNQYRTVEFTSDVKCGVNGCGENIYCLPANSNLKVEMKAASLKACTSNNDCTFAPFGICDNNVCKDSTTGKNYPTAPSLNGIVDLADNSLDGNRNDNPQGQADFYDENKTPQDNSGRGDNYLLSFWVSDRLDLSPPTITSTSVSNNHPGVNLTEAIEIIFSKLMMSSSLSTGTITVNNGTEDVVHKLINLWSLANNPIGYWIGKEDRDIVPLDGQPDRTSAFLNHGSFSDSTEYQAQVGSGVKDIYQNCYKPSTGPNCAANPLQPSCCREKVAPYNLVPTTNLTPDGNCP